MKNLLNICILTAMMMLFCCNNKAVEKPDKVDGVKQTWNFETVAVGKLPNGWKVEATNQKGTLATWEVIKDTTSTTGEKVFALSNIKNASGSTFNLCWTDTVSFLDGEIKVNFKAIRGNEDQGGGIIWRVQNKENYYIARFNPLENNFRVYSVRDGNRKTLESASIELAANKWHMLKIIQQGNRIWCYLNGKELLYTTDALFTKAGGVGLWTKADAVTLFDDFTVTGR